MVGLFEVVVAGGGYFLGGGTVYNSPCKILIIEISYL